MQFVLFLREQPEYYVKAFVEMQGINLVRAILCADLIFDPMLERFIYTAPMDR